MGLIGAPAKVSGRMYMRYKIGMSIEELSNTVRYRKLNLWLTRKSWRKVGSMCNRVSTRTIWIRSLGFLKIGKILSRIWRESGAITFIYPSLRRKFSNLHSFPKVWLEDPYSTKLSSVIIKIVRRISILPSTIFPKSRKNKSLLSRIKTLKAFSWSIITIIRPAPAAKNRTQSF